MIPLSLPYIANIIILIPIGLLTRLGGERGGQMACQYKFPESAGFRTILGSLWTAILLASILGLFYPLAMAPLLLIQITYKSLWLLVFVLPRLLKGRSSEVPWGIALTFLGIVVSYPLAFPWDHFFRNP